jgi:uncharacterized protein (TIGR03382 family)
MLRGSLILVGLGVSTFASADPVVYRDVVHMTRPDAARPAGPIVPNTRTIFMNKCTGGCTVVSGTTDNRTDHSDIATSGTHVLTQFSQSQAVWNATMSCMNDMFAQFNVVITDVDPGSTPHMEIMVAGTASQLLGSGSQGILGIADVSCSQIGTCDSFLPNALVFAFANDPYYSNAPLEICATAAQEIAHTWALDHVVDASDPMTYNNYTTMRHYKDNQACGSDCQGGQSPFGLPCSGSGGNATHACMMNNQPTQNEIQTILGLFGPKDATPPTMSITSPENGAGVQAGFEVDVSCTSADGVQSVTVTLDGQDLPADTTAPYAVKTPSSLANGSHHITARCLAVNLADASQSIDVTVGAACHTSSDCPDQTDTCYNGACIPGSGAMGGLGSPCTGNAQCASGMCASDGTQEVCVVPCDVSKQACPSGFGCIMAGAGGVCWPGADTGGGGCSSGGAGGEIVAGLGFALLLVRRRRR